MINRLCNDPALKERRRELRRNQTEAEKAFGAVCVVDSFMA